MIKFKNPTAAENYTKSLTYIHHFIDNARMQIEKMELENKTNPDVIAAKRKSLNLIDKFVFDTQKYIRQLEARTKEKPKNDRKTPTTANDYMKQLDIDDPQQREAKRYLSIRQTRSKWPELF